MLVRRLSVPPLNRLVPVPEAAPPASVQVPPAMFMMPGDVAVSEPPSALFVPPLKERMPARVSMTPPVWLNRLKSLIELVPPPALLRSVPELVQVMGGPP